MIDSDEEKMACPAGGVSNCVFSAEGGISPCNFGDRLACGEDWAPNFLRACIYPNAIREIRQSYKALGDRVLFAWMRKLDNEARSRFLAAFDGYGSTMSLDDPFDED